MLAVLEPKPRNRATPSALVSEIAAHPLLQGMDPKHLELLSACAMPIRLPKGHLIFREGELASRFYLILQGKVALEARILGGETVPIQILGGGDALGWSWLFPPYYWHFDARVIESTQAIFFHGGRLRAECDEDHDLGYELIKRIAAVAIRRLQAAREQMLALSERGAVAAGAARAS
jgi:CRP/FNR family transcriptional regulator, cyclic AMP receptor protein